MHINSEEQAPTSPYSVPDYCNPWHVHSASCQKSKLPGKWMFVGHRHFLSLDSPWKKNVSKEVSKNSLLCFFSSSLYKVLNTFLKEN